MAKRGQELTEKRSSNVQVKVIQEDRMKSDPYHQKSGVVCEESRSKVVVDYYTHEGMVCVKNVLRRSWTEEGNLSLSSFSSSCQEHFQNHVRKAVSREQNLEVTLACRKW